MIRKISTLLLAVLAVCLLAGQNAEAQDPDWGPVDTLVVVTDTAVQVDTATVGIATFCPPNHFKVDVVDCDGNPAPGVKVRLKPPDGSQETRVTDSNGRCCFARSNIVTNPTQEPPSWEPGYYGLTAGGVGELVYRAGNGNIHVDLSSCPPGR